MFTMDAKSANREYEYRLQEAEYERLAQRLQAQKPKLQTRFLEKTGELLIALGTSLKVQA